MGCSADKQLEALLEERDVMKRRENELKTRMKELEEALMRRDRHLDASLERSLLEDMLSSSQLHIPPADPSLKTQLHSLQENYQSIKQQHTKLVTQFICKRLTKVYKQRLRMAVIAWKYNPSGIGTGQPLNTETLDLDDDEFFVGQDFTEADLIIQREFQSTLQSNALLAVYREHRMPREAPMAFNVAVKLFENMMDKKHEADIKDLDEKRTPREMDEFMLEFLNRMFGLNKIAYKALNQLMLTLVRGCANNTGYLILFARIIKLVHAEPISFQLALYLTKVRVHFNRLLIEKKQKNSYEVGGLAYFADVVALVYTMIEHSRSTRTLLLKYMKPESISLTDLLVFHICFRFSRLGLSSEEFFGLFSTGSEVPEDEFIDSLKSKLDIYFSSNCVQLLVNLLDPANSGRITRKLFLKHFNMNEYFERTKSIEYTVSKSQFLNAIVEVYGIVRRRNTAHLLRVFALNATEPIDAEEVARLAKLIDPTLSAKIVQSIKREVGENEATPDVFDRVLLKFGIGLRAIQDFSIFGLERAKERKGTDVLDILLGSNGAIPVRSLSHAIKVPSVISVSNPRETNKF